MRAHKFIITGAVDVSYKKYRYLATTWTSTGEWLIVISINHLIINKNKFSTNKKHKDNEANLICKETQNTSGCSSAVQASK